MENKDFIISKFKEVKSLEYVPSNRANNIRGVKRNAIN